MTHPVIETSFESEPDEIGGAVFTGTQYFAGAGTDLVEVFFADNGKPFDVPTVYMLGRDGIELADLVRVLPFLNAALNDPRVRARLAAVQGQKDGAQ